MKVVQLVELGRSLEPRTVPDPEVQRGEVLVRIVAAGICRSDVHYKAGTSDTGPLPQTLGHEVAGVIEAVGADVPRDSVGTRVSLHYLKTCGTCAYCRSGREQFCPDAVMIGKHCDGGYAQYISVPAVNALAVPDSLELTHAAVMMCSTATSFHALRQARFSAGDRVAIFGLGGLGMSAIKLAVTLGALEVYAVDLNRKKLEHAEQLGAIPVPAADGSPEEAIFELSGGRGVDVALELVDLPATIRSSVRSLAVQGRAAIAGIGDQETSFNVYQEIMGSEREVIGVSDHTRTELEFLLELAGRGRLVLDDVVTDELPLDADLINARLSDLERFHSPVRSVIRPDLP